MNNNCGIVLYCFNNNIVRYDILTNFISKKIKSLTKYPIVVISDKETSNLLNKKYIDDIIIVEKKTGNMKKFFDGEYYYDDYYFNKEKIEVYNHSPFEKTLLLDIDYFILNEDIFTCFDSKFPFLINSKSHDLSYLNDPHTINISKRSIKFYWGTLFYFKKCSLMKDYFDICLDILDKYDQFSYSYDFQDKLRTRNDYIMSTAIHMLNGFSNNSTWLSNLYNDVLYYTNDNVKVLDFDDNSISFSLPLFKNTNKSINLNFYDNIHVMDKISLINCIDKKGTIE